MTKTRAKAWTVTTIANTPIKVLTENPDRIEFDVLNISDTEIFLGFDQSVTTSGRAKGKRIGGSYCSYTDDKAKDEIWIICASSGKEITIGEVTEVK